MQAVKQSFTQIIDGRKQFIIPVFQRDYSWSTEQCHQMWTAITRNLQHGGRHFMGAFVYVEGEATTGFSTWLVIDGQQRLTTLTLLLAALRDHIAENGPTVDLKTDTINLIDAQFLKNANDKGDSNYKLALRRADNATLRAILNGTTSVTVDEPSHLIMEAYHCFKDLLKSSAYSPSQVYEAIFSVDFVDVKLDRADNPQLVFESLNSTGVDLNPSDLVRNYLLMGLPEADQTRLYDGYWSKLESDFRKAGTLPDSFLRDYVALRTRSTTQTREDQVYDAFKHFWPATDTESTVRQLADMVNFARYYVSFLRPSVMQPASLIESMTQIRSGGVGSTHALLIMRLYDCYERGLLSEVDFGQSLDLIKSYLLRRAVLSLQTRDYLVGVCSHGPLH